VIVGVPQESFPGERRVSLVPAVIPNLAKVGLEVVVQQGAGVEAGYPDAQYAEKGAKIAPDRKSVFSAADIITQVLCYGSNDKTGKADLPLMRRDQVVIGFLRPLGSREIIQEIAAAGVMSFAVELMPRTTRAQSMDALSSMATACGYKAVLIAADVLPRFFPMLTTAAGTITPARVLILGVGVAGLQAIATARRLGAVVQGFDVRSAVKEQVQSLGAKFLEFDLGGDLEGAGGYARELTPEQQHRQQELMAEAIGKVDVVITTALVPGRRAPILVTEDAVKLMKPGSVIVDLAGEAGGNCELSEPGQTVIRHDVKILAPLNVPSTLAEHASQLYAKNIQSLLGLMISDEGQLSLDFDDEVIAGACITRDGEIVHDAARAAAESGATASS